jgi:hypothetical protein
MSQEPVFYATTNVDGSECHGDGRWSLPVLNADGSWTPGEWRAVGGRLVPWLNGLAISSEEHLLEWLGPAIWEVEIYGRVVRRRGIIVARQARLVRGFPAWNERTARLFAVDCASEVLHLAAPEVTPLLDWVLSVARRYAEGTATPHDLEVANAAAWGMTGGVWDSAESASAREAAAAAWSATIEEAWKAASDAASCAGRALASDAAPDTDAFMETTPEANGTWLAAWEAACQTASASRTELLMRVLDEREPEDEDLPF